MHIYLLTSMQSICYDNIYNILDNFKRVEYPVIIFIGMWNCCILLRIMLMDSIGFMNGLIM
jgi:hypothetical protein